MRHPDDGDGRPRLARPYTLVGGRVRRDGAALPLEALVWTADPTAVAAARTDAARTVLLACHGQARSIAEVAATLDVPLGVARVLVADLLEEGLLQRGEAPVVERDDGAMADLQLLQKVLTHVARL